MKSVSQLNDIKKIILQICNEIRFCKTAKVTEKKNNRVLVMSSEKISKQNLNIFCNLDIVRVFQSCCIRLLNNSLHATAFADIFASLGTIYS